MSEQAIDPDELEVAPGFTHEKLQGWVASVADEEELRSALEKAFDYRGDVTITCRDGHLVDGYVYDRRPGRTLSDSMVRILPADGSARQNIPYAEIAGLVFSDRDPAAGKSWEAWVRKYWDKRAKGEKAELQPEALE